MLTRFRKLQQMKSHFYLALWAAFTLLASAGPLQCFDNNKLCYQASRTSATASTADLMVSTTLEQGWIGVGFGRGMRDADILMLWRNEVSGEWILSRRLSTKSGLPPAAPVQNAVIVNSTTSANSQGFYNVLVRRPIAASSTTTAGDTALTGSAQEMSWAAYAGPTTATNLQQHDAQGSFTYNSLDTTTLVTWDATGNGYPTGGSSESVRPTALLVHAVCMGLTWSVLSFTSSFTARYLKHRIGAAWFVVHRGMAVAILVLTVAGFALVVGTNGGEYFASLHALIGLGVVLAMFVQIGLGIYIDKMFDPNRKSVPMHDKVHWWFGYTLLAAGALNVLLGHYKYGSSKAWIYANVAVVAAAVVAFVVGESKLGQSHDHHEVLHEENTGASSSSATGPGVEMS
ncbi:hypothetical protein BC828DRAFT_389552 [Blastocladiella britannica]|nr:hypothetical protein BC828DRAFT_389552 [Blastocladiella britannica]